jgi:hypothetical protein
VTARGGCVAQGVGVLSARDWAAENDGAAREARKIQ